MSRRTGAAIGVACALVMLVAALTEGLSRFVQVGLAALLLVINLERLTAGSDRRGDR